jgi:hypothetical protein
MFELKKILGSMLMPLPLLGLLCFIGLLIALRSNKFARMLVSLRSAVYYLLALPLSAKK